MNSFGIYGASDDLVELEADGKPHDELSPPKSFLFIAGAKSLHVRLSYNGKHGTGWKLSIELQDESERGDLPFDVRIVQERYSPKLTVENVREPVRIVTGTKSLGTLMPLATEKGSAGE